MNRILSVNERCYPAQFKHFGSQVLDPPSTVAVLVAGEAGDYACYIGHGTPEWVAKNGDKLCFREAEIHFPGIKKEKYRG